MEPPHPIEAPRPSSQRRLPSNLISQLNQPPPAVNQIKLLRGTLWILLPSGIGIVESECFNLLAFDVVFPLCSPLYDDHPIIANQC
ncbi:MAG: hypothetical protein IZT59_01940 [Verrucomicrobia bacterium]|nr:hypothetical protein [Verrucomicrobiota bacterium]